MAPKYEVTRFQIFFGQKISICLVLITFLTFRLIRNEEVIQLVHIIIKTIPTPECYI